MHEQSIAEPLEDMSHTLSETCLAPSRGPYARSAGRLAATEVWVLDGPCLAGKDDEPGKRGNGTGGGNENDGDGEGRTGIVTKTRPKTKKPSLYKVLLLNDDYTPMEFVVHVLERFFNKGREDATRIMLHVHHKGVGICGVYTFEVAETKVTLVTDFARQHQHPLRCTMEKE